MRHISVGLSLVILAALSVLTGFRPFFLVFYTLSIAVGLGYGLAWFQLRRLSVKYEGLDLYPQVGMPFSFRVTVVEEMGVPRMALRLETAGDGVSTTERVVSLAARGSIIWEGRVVPKWRGPGTLGSVSVAASDPLGLIKLERALSSPQNVLILPRTVSLDSGRSTRYRGLVEGTASSRRARESGSVARIREHVAGDSLRHIHWPSTARSGRLMTKEFDSGSEEEELWLFLDMRSGAHAGTGAVSTEETSVVIVASLAKEFLANGKSVGLIVHGEVRHRIDPSMDEGHLLVLMEVLAGVRAKGPLSLVELVAKESAFLGYGADVVFISPWPDPGLKAIPGLLKRRAMGVFPILLHAPSFDKHYDARWLHDPRSEFPDGACLIRMGDDPAEALRYVHDGLLFRGSL